MINNFTFKDIISNIFHTKIYTIILIFTMLILTVGYFIGHKALQPMFYNNMINIIINESKKVSQHLVNFNNHLHEGEEDEERLAKEFELLKQEFSLEKIKYFDKNGKTLYSTDTSEINTINSHEHFHNEVTKGKMHYDFFKDGVSYSDTKIVSNNIAEIYIPIIEKDQLKGAIEIFYDITEHRKNFFKIINKIENAYIFISIIFFNLVFITLYYQSISNLEKKKQDKEIKALNKSLTKKVKIRTKELEDKNKELMRLAHYDFLTGIYNRSCFFSLASKYLNTVKRHNLPFHIISLDLDNFKKINDTYGHPVGDKVLIEFTKIVSSYMRKSDLFGRTGGEEFIICIQNNQLDGVKTLAEKIRSKFEAKKIKIKDSQISATVSIGIAQMQSDDTLEELIEKSDKALYKAKEQGRNQTIVF
jgi:diguanylate cyclase (GGDEF)-like protein